MRILVAMNVPMWLLRLILSYLEHRKMILRIRGCKSDPEDMPGGTPQGTLIGVILYILYINPVGFPAEISVKISDILHEYWNILDDIPQPIPNNDSLPTNMQSVKFMDDATVQEAVNLLTQLVPNSDLTGKVLPKSNTHIQTQLDLIKKLSDDREMTLNDDKTCLFIVNFTENHQFLPLISIPGCAEELDVVLETKLLGYWLTKDMKTDQHVEYMLEICYKRLWAIIKLKKAGISNGDILNFFL